MEQELTELECGWCKETKPISNYSRQVKDPSQFYKWCDECRSKHTIEHEKAKKKKRKSKTPEGTQASKENHWNPERRYGRDSLLNAWEYKRLKPEFESFHGIRAKEYGCDGSKPNNCLTLEDWIQVRDYYGCCLKCGKTSALHCDHVVPLSKGGANRIWNIQPLCKLCNTDKFTEAVDYRTSFPRFVLDAMQERGVQIEELLV